MVRSRPWVAALLLSGLVTGCGGGSGAGNSVGTTNEADKSAQQILADAEASLSRVKSFHFGGTGHIKEGSGYLSGDVALPGRLRFAIRIGQEAVTLKVISGLAYLKANKPFMDKEAGGAAADQLADRWVKMRSSDLGDLASIFALSEPATIGRCALGPHFGTITKVGTGSVDGQKVVVLEDAGDKPGSQPGRIYIATDGPPLPLRVTQTGAPKAGATPDARCRETKSDVNDTSANSDDLRFSNYDKPVSIEAPRNAVDLSQLGIAQ